MNNLFLTGAKRIGKSTLIRKCLLPYRDMLGGFSSQRLLDVSGNIAGYRITEASDFYIERVYEPTLSGIFMIRDGSRHIVDLSVFRDMVKKMLIPTDQTKVMLLDEIGGVEMLDPEFLAVLYDLLDSDTPCIGVVKANKDSGNNAAEYHETLALRKENLLLRKFIENDPGSCLIQLPGCGSLFGEDAAEISVQTEAFTREFLTHTIHTS